MSSRAEGTAGFYVILGSRNLLRHHRSHWSQDKAILCKCVLETSLCCEVRHSQALCQFAFSVISFPFPFNTILLITTSSSPSLHKQHHSPTPLRLCRQQMDMVVVIRILACLGSIMSIRTRQALLLHQPADLVGWLMSLGDEAA